MISFKLYLMNIFIFSFIFLACIWLFDKTCLWLERKGWLYYKLEKPKGGIFGSALQELNAQIIPSNRNFIMAQKKEVIQEKKRVEDAPSD